MYVTAVIVAAGAGTRMGGQTPKQFIEVCGRPVLWWAVRAFQVCDEVDSVVLVSDPASAVVGAIREAFPKVGAVVPGGKERQDSVWAGLEALPASTEVVLVHDGARCLVTTDTIERVISAAKQWGAAVAAVPLDDTIKRVDASGLVVDTPERNGLYRVQTPQGFRVDLLRDAFSSVPAGRLFTDDSSMVEYAGGRVRIVHGSADNIKITSPVDLELAKQVLCRREIV
jgi:2-C-methyl-D-erythritol 4-phosphate cytidylyltransferase